MKQEEFKKGEIIIYESKDGPNLEVRLEEETIWLTQEKIALLFGTQRSAITKHLKNIFDSGELDEKVVSSILEHTTKHGALKGKTQTKKVKYYNLDAINIRWLSSKFKKSNTISYLGNKSFKRTYSQRSYYQ